jgi:hypothetical protein
MKPFLKISPTQLLPMNIYDIIDKKQNAWIAPLHEIIVHRPPLKKIDGATPIQTPKYESFSPV